MHACVRACVRGVHGVRGMVRGVACVRGVRGVAWRACAHRNSQNTDDRRKDGAHGIMRPKTTGTVDAFVHFIMEHFSIVLSMTPLYNVWCRK